jgi:hypothetical protein
MMLLDPNDEDGVCGDAYQEWQNSYDATGEPEWVFDRSFEAAEEWYDDEQDNEWECE